jgi:predicted transcriptional regulator
MNKKDFLETVETFMKTKEMSATTFGILANKEPNLVFTLREGRECREETQARVLDFINNYKQEE